jgi:hypothetical protein
VSNRLKHPPGGGGQERQKPWRHDQSPHSRSRRHNGPRPAQGQQGIPARRGRGGVGENA